MNAHASAVAARSAVTMRKLASALEQKEAECAQLQAKVAAYERRDRIHDLARQMDERGVSPEMSFDQKVASINHHCKTAGAFDTLETAIKLAGTGRVELATVDDETPVHGANPTTDFHSFLVNG